MSNFYDIRKVTYDEIKDTFIVTWGGKKFSLFHQKPTIGISPLGIWIGNWSNVIQIGFLRWEWINRIDISQSNGSVFFVLHDFESVYNAIIPTFCKFDVNLHLVLKSDEGKVFAIIGHYFGNDYQCLINIIEENNFAEIRIIE